MKAAVFYGPHQPLKIEEIPRPKPERGEVLVRVAACGVCHTDLHYIDHGVPTFKKPPMVLGHEASGVVEETGEGVTHLKGGEKVLIPAVFSCGSCFFCRTGRENICKNMIMLGNNVDGAYAEFVCAPAKDCLVLPDGIPLEDSSIVADAISTPFHAVKNRARVQPGDKVVVFGCGGVGLNIVQIASIAGGIVIAVDVLDKKLEWAKKLGASYTIKAGTGDTAKEIRKLTGGGADIAIEAIGNPATIEEAFNSLRNGGRLCIVGYTDKNVSINAGRIMYREMEIVGSLGCRPVDYISLLDLVSKEIVKVRELVTHRFPLSKINDAFDTLRKGEAIRSIVIPSL